MGSAGPSEGASAVDTILAEVFITPPDGVEPEHIRDTLINSSMLGSRVGGGIDSVNEVYSMQAANGGTVKVTPYRVPVVKETGLPLWMMVSAAVGVLSVLTGI